jgi:hypothetical protein
MRVAFYRIEAGDKAAASDEVFVSVGDCVLAALAFLAAQPEVASAEVAPPMTSSAVSATSATAVSTPKGSASSNLAKPSTPKSKGHRAVATPRHRSLSNTATSALQTDLFASVGVDGTGQFVQVIEDNGGQDMMRTHAHKS